MCDVRTASWQTWGMKVVLKVMQPAALTPAQAIVQRELAAIDRACSRFRSDSELACVNAAGGRRVTVSPLFMQALQVALRAAALTDGDVDPTLGVALQLAGYDRDWALLSGAAAEPPVCRAADRPTIDRSARDPQAADPQAAYPQAAYPTLRAHVRSGWRTVELDPHNLTVRLPASIQLDLGASAKAWAADRAALAVMRELDTGVLLSLGGDIASAGSAPAHGWRIRVTDDHRSSPSAPGQTIAVSDGGLATSSTTVRRWSHAGRTMHHIIDPRTHAPLANGAWRTVSVAAASCLDANIASTAALIRALDASSWLRACGLPARLVDHEGRVQAVGGWPS
jgi:thiamine biosynthesis lipoprotein